ncbi:hypothetical protein H9P43_002945 [Blastocladiella emersonii ATCC 22665]|nr:hypothetical protein H9P43_002945 [Blastocladiella emersonii ATCC 22665]
MAASAEALDRIEDLQVLDKEVDRIKRDIENLLGHRAKEGAKHDGKRYRMSIVPRIEILSQYQEIRDAKLAEVTHVSTPSRVATGWDTMRKDIETLWAVNEPFRPKNLPVTLIKFFRERIHGLMEEKQMLLHRARTIGQDEQNLAKYRISLVQHFDAVEQTLADAVERYDRLMTAGYMVPGKPGKGHAKGAVSHSADSKRALEAVETDDIKLLAQYRARTLRASRDFDTFVARVQNLSSTDVEEIASLIREERDQPSPYRTSLPQKQPIADDFLADFESLATWFSLDTSIEAEDGRAFAYAVDRLFQRRYTQLKLAPNPVELTPPPVQTLGDAMVNALDAEDEPRIVALEHIPIKVVKATWLDDVQNHFGELRDTDMATQKHERIDFQLRYEYDLIASDNQINAKDHLQMTLKYYTEETMQQVDRDLLGDDDGNNKPSKQIHAHPKSNPSSASLGINQSGGAAHLHSARTRSSDPSQQGTLLGMLVPKSEGGTVQMTAKRQQLVEIKKMADDPLSAQVIDVLGPKSPDNVGSIFSPHEVHAFLQLRFLKTRELRMILLRQLNFFRSVERRLVQDLQDLPWQADETLDPMSFETGAPLRDLSSFVYKRNVDLAQTLENHTLNRLARDDTRTIHHRLVYLSNDEGQNIIYDVSYADLKTVEARLMRMASAMINRNAKESEDHRDDFFMEHARLKLRDHKDIMDVSFAAPEIDRQQMLLELFESEVKLNERKMMLVNALLEMYEHVSWPTHRRALVHRAVQIMCMPRVHDQSEESPLRAVALQMKALEAQEQLVVEALNHAISQQCAVDWGNFNFHHGSVSPIHISEFVMGLGPMVGLHQLVDGQAHDLHLAVTSTKDGSAVSRTLVECAVWQRVLALWHGAAVTGFLLPETPRKLLFHFDLISRPETVDQLLADIYTAQNGSLESLVHPIMGNTMAPSPENDPAFQARGIEYASTYVELLEAYHRLKSQWLETHYLHQIIHAQIDMLGVSSKIFFANLSPLPFDLAEAGDLHTQSVDLSDDEDTFKVHQQKEKVQAPTATPLGITELDETWGNVVLESMAVLRQFTTGRSTILREALRCQILEKYLALAVCQTNHIIFNRIEDRLRSDGVLSSVYSGDYTAVALLPNSFKRQIRRQTLATFQADWKKISVTAANPVEDKIQAKARAIAFYGHHLSGLLQEQASRIHLIKIQRCLPAGTLSPASAARPAIMLSKADTESASRGTSNVGGGSGGGDESSNQAPESMVDIDRGKYLRIWCTMTAHEVLALHHRAKFPDQELSGACSPVFAKLVQVYSLLREIMRLSYALGDHLNERGEETSRQLLLAIKKEVLNFGSPVAMDKLLAYFAHRWTVLRLRLTMSLLSSSYCLLVSPTLAPTMAPFFALHQYYRRIASYPRPPAPVLPFGIPLDISFRSSAMEQLSLTDRKICSERFNELEAFLEDIFHQSNLESLAVESALINQTEYLKMVSRLLQLRFELLSVTAKRRPFQYSQVSTFVSVYKTQVISTAYREFVANQRRKGSHIEDVTATRNAQMEFEKCQVSALRQTLLLAYTRAMVRSLRSVFDLLVDERTDALFAHREAFTVPRPYMVQAYPVELHASDFSHKAALFDDFNYELYACSLKTTAALIQACRDKGRVILDERTATVEVDTNVHFVVRREFLAQALATLSTKLTAWNQIKWKEFDEFYSNLHSLTLDLLTRQRNLLESYSIEQSLTAGAYERDVRLGASIKASEIFLELSTIGSELAELKKARRTEEKLIRARVRQEYEELVGELSSQIHKLKARFTEFRINSVDEALSALSEVKKDDLLAFINKDYHAKARETGNTIISLQETIDEIRSDNAELKQMSKLKSMYALKSMTSRSVYAKRVAHLIEEKRVAEERLWESYRDSEARERVLRRNLIKCQKDLVSIQTQHDSLKRAMREEQRAKELLQKALSVHVSENKSAMEMASLRKVENFTRFEFERILDENKRLSEECGALKLEVARLQNIIQAQEWRTATKQRLRMSTSRPSSPSPLSPNMAAASMATAASPTPEPLAMPHLTSTSLPPAPLPLPLPHPRPTSAARDYSPRTPERRPGSSSRVASTQSTPTDRRYEEITLNMRDAVSPKRPMTAKRESVVVPALRLPLRPQTAVVSRRHLGGGSE